MASYNRVILVGNLTRDIELKYTPGGTAVTDIGMAVNDRRKSASGEWVDETTFVDVTLWGRTAEVASEYLGKGSPILVEGRLKLDTWETDGQKRSKLRVVCDRMQMLGGGAGGGGGSGGGGGGVRVQAATNNRVLKRAAAIFKAKARASVKLSPPAADLAMKTPRSPSRSSPARLAAPTFATPLSTIHYQKSNR